MLQVVSRWDVLADMVKKMVLTDEERGGMLVALHQTVRLVKRLQNKANSRLEGGYRDHCSNQWRYANTRLRRSCPLNSLLYSLHLEITYRCIIIDKLLIYWAQT